jgi:hypothetical protein
VVLAYRVAEVGVADQAQVLEQIEVPINGREIDAAKPLAYSLVDLLSG